MTRAPQAAELFRLPYGPARNRAVYDLFMGGRTKAECARLSGLSLGQVGAAIRWCYAQGLPRKGRKRGERPAPDAEREPETARGGKVLRWPSFVYGVDDEPEQPVAWFTGQLRLSGDFIIVGDIHAPTTDWELAERMLAVAEHHLSTPRQLLIAGDLLNMDAISRFPDRTPPVPLRQELRAANKFILRMLTVFDHVYAFMGNHDVRLQYSLQGDITIRQFARLITDAYESIVFSPYSDVYITSGGQQWYVPHQTNYRQNKLSVADDLAARKWMNIITTHQHHSAVGRDKGNNATIVDCGGLHEPLQMGYAQLNPSTRPCMTKGFVLLRNGCASLLTPYPTMTDWDVWLPRKVAAERKAA